MALHREGFYCMYFSQQESGQSTLCEHLIGLTAGEEEVVVEEEEEEREGKNPTGIRETKTQEEKKKCESVGF